MSEAARNARPKILVLYNEDPAWPQRDIDMSQAMLSVLVDGLREQGYAHAAHKFFDDLSGLDAYDPREWLVWNWGEELAGRSWTEAEIAEELERRGLAYTGSPPAVLRRCQNRLGVKQLLQDAGLPTLPARVFADPAPAGEWPEYPAMVKGANQHSSYGIDRQAVVANAAELAARIEYLRRSYDDEALVEPFLDTREFQVAVWGNEVPKALPPLEFDYSAFDDPQDRLYTYDWKFNPDSRGYHEIKMVCPAPADRPDWQARLMEVSVGAYRALGLRDYGRIDLRMQGDEPQILDVNPNPDLENVSVLPASSHSLGMSYGEMLDHILCLAAERMPLG
jgi:D-alanine-D-alanine ligase